MKRATRTGFTLLELLIVVAILAVLAGFLLPVLGRAREQGRVTKCISNEKQIFLALKMYEADYGKLPVQYGPSGKDQWLVMLIPYTKSRALFLCDSDATRGELNREGGPFPCSYSYLYTQPNLLKFPGPVQLPYRQPRATSPLIVCGAHSGYQCIMGRYDGSIELSPQNRYLSIGIELE